MSIIHFLMKQLWNLGIQDRKVLACISKMLKAEIDGEGIPSKGVPQGGLLSTLLSNVVLNDLDQWVAGQWEFFPLTKHYKTREGELYAKKRTNSKKGTSSAMRTTSKFSVEMGKQLKSGTMQ